MNSTIKYVGVDGGEYLVHFGILGQKWGVRRFQNPDGTLTEAGKKRYYKDWKRERAAYNRGTWRPGDPRTDIDASLFNNTKRESDKDLAKAYQEEEAAYKRVVQGEEDYVSTYESVAREARQKARDRIAAEPTPFYLSKDAWADALYEQEELSANQKYKSVLAEKEAERNSAWAAYNKAQALTTRLAETRIKDMLPKHASASAARTLLYSLNDLIYENGEWNQKE